MDIVKKDEIVRVLGVYKSQLYLNWWAAQVVVQRNGKFFRIRLPYNTSEQAYEATQFLNGEVQTMPEPVFKPIIHESDVNGHVR